jgi:DNA-binding transcriptional regulator YiaG
MILSIAGRHRNLLSNENAIDQHIMLITKGRTVSTENVDKLSSAQCRAARALLEVTQPELAKSAGLGLSTIVDFERSRRRISQEALEAIKNALQDMGICFIAENGGGAGVRLRTATSQSNDKKGHRPIS